MKCLTVKSRQEWRKWLEINHLKAEEIWLIHFKKHSGKAKFSYDDAVEEALCFGWIDSQMKRIDDEKFRLKYTPRRKNSPWSEINKKRAERLIDNGRMTEEGFNKIKEAKKNGKWFSAYSSKKKPVIPPDLKKALKESKKAWENFSNFANSYQTNYIYWINDAQRKETRVRRILEVVNRSIDNKKPGEE